MAHPECEEAPRKPPETSSMAMTNGATFAPSPEARLASLIETDMGVTLPPSLVRLFMLKNWRALRAYGHAIHGTREEEPGATEKLHKVIDVLAADRGERAEPGPTNGGMGC